MIRAIVFDFDGVILESADIKTEAFRQLFKDRFPDQIEQIVEYHKQNMGISRFVKFRHIYKQSANKPLDRKEESLLGEEFSKIVFDQILKAPMVPGVQEFLEADGEKYLLFVASGTPEEELTEIMAKRNLLRYFIYYFGPPQGKADIIRHIMKKYRLEPLEVAFVGDAESDYQAAITTGVHFIAKTASLSGMNQILNQLNKDVYANESR